MAMVYDPKRVNTMTKTDHSYSFRRIKSALSYVLAAGLIFLCIFVFHHEIVKNYDVKYVNYKIESGDTLFSAVKDLNGDGNYDIQKLILYAKQKNGIKDAGSIQPGVYKIPVIKNGK